MSFGERLKAARKNAGLSQTELAADRCSVSYVSHLESGRRTPTPEMLRHFETVLGLETGVLGGPSDLSGPGRRKAGEAEAVALYSEAMLSWRQGAYGLAYEQAHEAREQIPGSSRADLGMLISGLLVEIDIDLSRYAEAATEASAHLAAARATGSALLEARAAIMASKAARLNSESESAATNAANAVQLCTSGDLPAAVRVPALIAAISAGHADSARYGEDLAKTIEGLGRQHVVGLAEWVLGTLHMRRGELEAGMAAHERAAQALSPTADFRNWARFPRAVADERLDAGCEEGVDELLDQAQRRLALLDSDDELAALAIARARFARLQARPADALAIITQALAGVGLPDDTRGRLRLVGAEVSADMGDAAAATSMALLAAREFTDAGDVVRARAAWNLVDSTGAAAGA